MDAGRSGGKPTDILPAGAVIAGKYRVERALGAGAMGAVFVAVHTGTGRKVALKVVTGEIAREDLVARFQREARAAGVIETQHITQVLDTGVDQATGLPFLVMELLQGEDVQQLLKRIGPLPPDLALRIVAQACLGLQKAHEANVVHRDIKPANLFLARRDAGEIIIKLLDFGIAKVMMEHSQDAEGASMTRTGSMLGSPLYMSPEQARGVKDIDHRADVWSLGIVLYQALSGKTPYHHITALGELIIAICSIPPQPIQEIAPWVPRDVAAIVHWALRIDRNERFQSAQAMFQAVRALLPYGWNIGDEMITPLSDGQRAQRETVLSTSQMTGPAPVGVPTGRHTAASHISSASMAPPPVIAGARTMDPATTTSALTQSQVAGATSPSKVPLIAAAVVALGILAGGGAYFIAGSPKGPVETTPQAASPPPQPTAPPTAAPTAAPAVTAAEERRVKLVVLPMDASVEIDGQPATVKDGIVELSGGLGVTRSVRVFKGGSETIEDVAITDMGPLPPKVELEVKRGPGKAPTPGTPGQPGKPGTLTGPAPTPAPGIKDRFE